MTLAPERRPLLTIVVYHYVRDADPRFPAMKARTVAEFEGQLDYIERHYEPVRLEDVRAAYAGERALPERGCLLTFDDGVSDHRDTVVPALARRGLPGCFAAAADAVLERHVLDVQKSQFALAAEPDHRLVLDRVLAAVEPFAAERPELAPAELSARYAGDDRFDDADTVLVKRLLQYALPEDARRAVLNRLFAELVTSDERAFADELYVSLDDLRAFREQGLEIAGHGVGHLHLGKLDRDSQRQEIDGTRGFLARIGDGEHGRWTMSLPSGSYDSATIDLLREAGCALAMTVEARLAGPDA
ncbi:MAG: polysaccharide deacetylase family protein, partial [Gaiellaceae bacterium]